MTLWPAQVHISEHMKGSAAGRENERRGQCRLGEGTLWWVQKVEEEKKGHSRAWKQKWKKREEVDEG